MIKSVRQCGHVVVLFLLGLSGLVHGSLGHTCAPRSAAAGVAKRHILEDAKWLEVCCWPVLAAFAGINKGAV